MIYTTYFANVKHLPRNIIPISIARKNPNGWMGLEYKRLAPKWELLKTWKKTQDKDLYVKEFAATVINKLNAESVVRELFSMIPIGYDIALVCYEKPEDFCHRHLVASWLNFAGYKVKEYI